MAETPAWAVYGAQEKGFDPAEVRFLRNKTKPPGQVCCSMLTIDGGRVVNQSKVHIDNKPIPSTQSLPFMHKANYLNKIHIVDQKNLNF
jgi:hypothetical protein